MRVWSVAAGVDDAAAARHGGVVVAADLRLAAEQLCAYLDDELVDSGRCRLFASRGSLDPRDVGDAMRVVAPVLRDPETGAVAYGDWRLADATLTTSRGEW
ncbi:hypothetical protein [Nocardia blacklockiae]|uniref:hypothetical protein n=1 Tax=Nocardia blacklockiae TaxID=480036 RepID=UPI001894D462|nr:hypothetical protein [Nocardia blacklockiae]MBF6173751.1 hypothetical protein [Nocardia blacklockiae]